MPALSFEVIDAPRHLCAAPLLELQVRVVNATPEPIHSVTLRCQVKLETRRRRYEVAEQERMRDLFGEPERWSKTLHSMLWTLTSAVVGPFVDCTTVKIPVACTFDFNAAAAKYFHGLEGGEVPLTLLFSGTIFYEGADGALQVAQIPWECEAGWQFPVRVWHEMMDHYYPNTAWLCLQREVADRLHLYRIQHGLTAGNRP